jgi:peptidoglycan/LPS O-acetylase OafA/YrhL
MLLILFFTFIMLISPIVQHEAHLASIYSNPFFRFIEFCIGLLIAQLNDEKKDTSLILSFLQESWVLVITFIVLVGGVTLATFVKIPKDYMLYSWIALPCFEVIFIKLGRIQSNCFENKSLLYCSKISYAFFMAQLFAWDILKWLFSVTEIPNINILRILMSFVVCMGISVILYEFIQKPVKNIALIRYKK